MSEPAMCGAHPEALAGWRCDRTCNRGLCSKCTAKLLNQFLCCTCGGNATQLTVPRTSQAFSHWVGAAVQYPLRAGLKLFVLVVLVMGAIPFVLRTIESSPQQLDGVSNLVRFAVGTFYVLLVVDAAVRGGHAEAGTPLRLLRAVVATAIVWVPGLAYVLLLGAPTSARDPILWLYALDAAVFLPIALAVGVTDASLGQVINPFVMFDLAWKLGRRYLAFVAAVIVLGALAVIAASSTIASLRASVPTPLVGDIVAILPTMGVLTMVAAMIGMISFVHGATFGWGAAESYGDPLYPRMVPEGVRKVVRAESQTIETLPSEARAGLAPDEKAAAAKLAGAIKAETLSRALQIYESRPSWTPGTINASQLLTLARAASRARNPDLAVRLLEDAHSLGGRSAPQALLALAQLRAELGHADQATALYQRIITEHAGTDAAKTAKNKLAT